MTGTKSPSEPVHIVGAGLAGSEAAWQVANAGIRVVLHEMRPVRMTEAHRTDGLAELVCSNSFRSDDAARRDTGAALRWFSPAGRQRNRRRVEVRFAWSTERCPSA